MDPSSTALRRALSEWLNGPDRRASDTAVIYYSGHGDSQASYFYLLTADSKENQYADTALRADYVVEALGENPKVRRVLLILDACCARREAFDAAAIAARMSPWQNFSADDEGVWIIAVASPKQEAQERLFTDVFIEAVGQLQQTTGTLQPYIGLEALVWQINASLQRSGKHQRASWIPAALTQGLAPFIPNPRYEPDALANMDLETRNWLRRGHASELAGYWSPRARGVEVAAQAGWYFTGRQAAMAELVEWLANPTTDGRLRVLTGDPGSGKSAVLGRLVVLTDTSVAARPPGPSVDRGTVAPAGSITAALLARGKTADELLAELEASLNAVHSADLAEERLPLRDGARTSSVDTVVIDALDEADDPLAVIEKVISPLHDAASAGHGPRLLVATRRHLLDSFPAARVIIDLDQDIYRSDTDTTDYVTKVLLAADDPDSPTPYRDLPALARHVASQVAAIAGRNFLIAQIAARTLAQAPRAVEPSEVSADRRRWRDVGAAFDRDLDRYGSKAAKARDLLTPLAWAEGAGLPRELWAPLATTLADEQHYADEDITWLLEQAGVYLVESLDHDRSVYRLYHEQLAEHLRSARNPGSAHERITTELLRHVPAAAEGRREWLTAVPYIRTYLAAHAAKARVLDQLVNDPGFLLAADRARLLATLATVTDPQARKSASAFESMQHLQPGRPPGQAAAQLDLAARAHGATVLADGIGHLPYELPWTITWGHWAQPDRHVVLGRHAAEIQAVATATIDGTPVVVSGGLDGMRIWDLRTGAARGKPLHGPREGVRAVAIGDADGTPVAVTGGADGTMQVWDLRTGTARGEPHRGHIGEVVTVTIGMMEGTPVAVTGGADGTVQVWDLRTRAARGEPYPGHIGGVAAVAIGNADGTPVAVTGSFYGTVRMWDLRTGTARGEPHRGHYGGVAAVAIGNADGTPVAVTGGTDGTMQVWDLRTGTARGEPLHGPREGVRAVAIGDADGTPVAVTGGADGTMQVWDLRTGTARGEPHRGHIGEVAAVAIGNADGSPVAVTGGSDGTVRAWDLGTGTAREGPLGSSGAAKAAAICETDGTPVAVTSGTDGTVQVWNLGTGTARGEPLRGHIGEVVTVAIGMLDGTPVAVTGGTDGTVRVWDLWTGTARGEPLRGPDARVAAVTIGEFDGAPVTVIGFLDGTVLVQNLQTGMACGKPLRRRYGGISAVAIGKVDSAPVAVAGGPDGMLQVWDLRTWTPRGKPLRGSSGKISAVALGEVNGTPVLVSGDDKGMISTLPLEPPQGVSMRLNAPAAITAIAFAGQIGWLTSTMDGSLFMWRPTSIPGQGAGRTTANQTSFSL